MADIVEDVRVAAEWVATAMTSSGYKADFTPGSLWEIDSFFDDHCIEGRAVPGGLLSEDLGNRLFALGSYVGEVIRRSCGGEWGESDHDPERAFGYELRMPGGATCWPIQRTIDRLRNGPEDGIAVYGRELGLDPGPRPIPREGLGLGSQRTLTLSRWIEIPVGLVLGVPLILCTLGALLLLFTPPEEDAVFCVLMGLFLLFGCIWALEKCFRLITGRANRGGLMTPRSLRVVAVFFLLLPLGGLFTGYYAREGVLAVRMTAVHVGTFFALRALARVREARENAALRDVPMELELRSSDTSQRNENADER